MIASRWSTHEALLREGAKRGIVWVVEKPLAGGLAVVDLVPHPDMANRPAEHAWSRVAHP